MTVSSSGEILPYDDTSAEQPEQDYNPESENDEGLMFREDNIADNYLPAKDDCERYKPKAKACPRCVCGE